MAFPVAVTEDKVATLREAYHVDEVDFVRQAYMRRHCLRFMLRFRLYVNQLPGQRECKGDVLICAADHCSHHIKIFDPLDREEEH